MAGMAGVRIPGGSKTNGMEYYNNILCASAEWLTYNGILTDSQYRHMVERKQVNVVRRGCRNTPALVAYESIPSRFQTGVREVLGCDPYEAAKTSELMKYMADNGETSRFFEEEYLLADGRRLPKETRAEYYANAIILDAIGEMIADKKAKNRARSRKGSPKWDEVALGVQNLDRTKWAHTLPANPRSLENKFKRYKKEGLESLIHKNFQNIHAAKVDDEIKESYLIELLAAPNNLDNSQVSRLYNIHLKISCRSTGQKSLRRFRGCVRVCLFLLAGSYICPFNITYITNNTANILLLE